MARKVGTVETDSNGNNEQRRRQFHPLQLWELPDAVLFHVASYVAGPTHRAEVFCRRIAPLCRASYAALLGEEDDDDDDSESAVAAGTAVGLWQTVLQEDYGSSLSVSGQQDGGSAASVTVTTTAARKRLRRPEQQRTSNSRRQSARLRRSPVQQVRDAHLRMKDNTEIAFFYLSEMVTGTAASSNQGQQQRKKRKRKRCESFLSLGNMVRVLDEYGPRLRINDLVSNGGLFLVETCRARRVTERVVLKCVRELVERRGAVANSITSESNSTRETPLCVAAVRGMPSVVAYLLNNSNADPTMRSSGRFRLHTNKHKTVRCNDVTPLEFCRAMQQAELREGATQGDLRNLDKCIRLLVSAEEQRQQQQGKESP